MDTIQIDGWQGHLGQGLAPRQLLAVLWAATDKTAKEIARRMDCSHYTVKQQLDDARFKLGARTTRGLCLEAMKRGIISPLVLLLCLSTGISSIDRPVQRPVRPVKVASVMRAQRQEIA
ncbi:helix-turn-helix transcriptional regulator [Pseudomonas sp. KSR10]|uniref:helix-turn-helix transcriptional regulator n=1 Tax=Pseudomonas sp. KSR10 TaxID=2916654 RepID=UPI001EF97C35|nr:helix-turn-helix transcriptional regulator [Pseudomonas sp. KSR10]MCG6540209.1 helix-turn-helix transcriptional regulator [Pseudomonas sp. KSR10]